ncbi:MAG: hypothetical protein ABSG42_00815 [Nitrospirota bacterium]
MKKLLLMLVLSAVLIPASAFAGSAKFYFTNMTSTAPASVVFSARWAMRSTGGIVIEGVRGASLINGRDHGILEDAGDPGGNIGDGVRYFEDHITFPNTQGYSNAEIVLTGDLVRTVFTTDTVHKGPVSFTLTLSDLVKNGQLVVNGASEVTKVRSGKNGYVAITFQPSSATFTAYTTGGGLGHNVKHIDITMYPVTMPQAFRDYSAVGGSLPTGF